MNLKNITTGLFGGSLVLLITINIFNAFNFIFQFAMARLLISADYAILAALMSLVYIFNVASESIQTIITKFSSKEEHPGKLKNLLTRSLRKGLFLSFIALGSYLIIAILLGIFLKISYPIMALTGILIFSVILLPIPRGILQGRKKFNALGWNMVIEASTKLLLAIIFVLIGWKVAGAIFAIFLATLLAFIFAFVNLRKIVYSKELSFETPGINLYSFPVFIVMLAVITFYSLDVILAKSFFSNDLAGQYAIASMLAKIIFFGTVPISKAMFPISSAAENKKQSRSIFLKSLAILIACIIIALTILNFAPDLVINVFSGATHKGASEILLLTGVSMSIISITNLFLLYKLSTGRFKNHLILLAFIPIEILILSLFHATLLQYSLALLVSNIIFLVGSVLLSTRK